MTRWRKTIDVAAIFANFDPDADDIADTRDDIVAILERDLASDLANNDYGLEQVIDGLRYAETLDEFNEAWDYFYDWADDERVWVKTGGI